MSMSLREQLLQAGLINKKQAQQAGQQQRKQSKSQAGLIAQQKLAVQQAQAAKTARDQALNRQQQEKAEKKARIAQIKQLIEQNRVPKIDSDDHYNFIDGNKIRRVPVNSSVRERLVRGELVIVRHAGSYAIVPAATAERIGECDAYRVIPHPVVQENPAEREDFYKDYVIPDDLMW